MLRIEPSTFKGPRCYFTNFDYKIISRTRNKDKLRREIERKLKLLLLTKDTIVCAASHLTSEFTYKIFKDNPVLLNRALVIPALRKDKNDISELFNRKRLPTALKGEMINFYKNNIFKTVNWELKENSKWFRDRFINELYQKESILRKNLCKLSEARIISMIQEIERDEILEREKIDVITADLGLNERRVIINFRELIYHISGARVVNCESALPQENYIDYSLADLNKRKIILSEIQIFWKLFLELAFETMQKNPVPLEFLDYLSFNDICELRNPIGKTNFKYTYDMLIKKSVAAIRKDDDNQLLYDVQELLCIKDNISKEYELLLTKEINAFLRKRGIDNIKQLGKETISFGLGAAGFFYPIIKAGTLILESPAFIVNLNQNFNNLKAVSNYDMYLKHKEKVLKKSINEIAISDKAPLLEIVDMIMQAIAQKITL